MPLDIGIADVSTAPSHVFMRLMLQDDACYWFSYPHFEELQQQTGNLIDLYGGAWFHGKSLDDLLACLAAIKVSAEKLAPQWEQCVGHSIGSRLEPTEPIPIYKQGSRDDLLRLLDTFIAVAAEAKRDGKGVACVGD